MTTSWRMFCAVELPAEVRAQMQHHIERLRREVPDAAASWSRVENIHLTLKFFGNVPVERIDTISNAICQAVKGFQPFEISVGNTGVFPKASRPQVLWVGVGDSSGKLSALHARMEDECAAVGFETEGRAYRPHLTIARLRKPEGARRLADAHLQQPFEPVEVRVREVVGFRSELSSKGSKYTAIFIHRLQG
jgi:RNA 2',3'-cyclic 3'-phosphodiesterase